MPFSLTSLLDVKEQWDNIESSLKDSYLVVILQREDSESDLVRLVKREGIMKYLEEINYQLKTTLNYKNLLRYQ